jgi:hypothetical protein
MHKILVIRLYFPLNVLHVSGYVVVVLVIVLVLVVCRSRQLMPPDIPQPAGLL